MVCVEGVLLHQGFQRVADGLADTCLDNPAARERFVAITAQVRARPLLRACAPARLLHAREACRVVWWWASLSHPLT